MNRTMWYQDQSTFRKLASLVRVRDLQGIGPNVEIDMTPLEAGRLASEHSIESDCDPMELEMIVFSGSEAVGTVWYEELDNEISLCDSMTPITVTRVLPAEATYFEAVRAFRERKCRSFVVIDGGGPTGTLALPDLLKPPGRMCLFALTLELEVLSQDACIWRGLFASLPDARKDKAREVFRKKQQGQSQHEPTERELIENTTFIDKGTMLLKGGSEVLSGWSSPEIKSLFTRAEHVRNACAHPTDEASFMWGTLKGQLGEFIDRCEALTAVLQRMARGVDS
jgi:hypothetical protein